MPVIRLAGTCALALLAYVAVCWRLYAWGSWIWPSLADQYRQSGGQGGFYPWTCTFGVSICGTLDSLVRFLCVSYILLPCLVLDHVPLGEILPRIDSLILQCFAEVRSHGLQGIYFKK
ncbi:hypothetical protein BDV26DRAFT_254176 [Aspergillus bertholletiae]|uniref:Uncharacterized protein n=1 Tax=Aspergillus bertholletiae TaxID=1226010 RepID=A0A5N7BKE8_9EURO|nr:hypothetical protein BDV26DRAFT_254176 [Aspergillus bertholletiae]